MALSDLAKHRFGLTIPATLITSEPERARAFLSSHGPEECIAKPLGRIGNANATLTMDRFLTPSSAAPEQLVGGPITVACDIHALGMLLYELLAGRLPFAFANMTPGEIEKAIMAS